MLQSFSFGRISIGTLSLVHPFSGSMKNSPILQAMCPKLRTGGKDRNMYVNLTEFGKRISDRRKELKMTQQQLADSLGLASYQHISRIERGIEGCSIDLLSDISDVLHISTDYLLKGKKASLDSNLLRAMAGQLIEVADRYDKS